MQTRSFRGSGEPAWVIASSNACEGLGPDPRKALGPAAIRAALTGRTHDRTRPMLHQRKKALANQAPSTHDPPGGLPGHHGELSPRPHRAGARDSFLPAAASPLAGRAYCGPFDPAEWASATKPNSSTHAIALKQRCTIA